MTKLRILLSCLYRVVFKVWTHPIENYKCHLVARLPILDIDITDPRTQNSQILSRLNLIDFIGYMLSIFWYQFVRLKNLEGMGIWRS